MPFLIGGKLETLMVWEEGILEMSAVRRPEESWQLGEQAAESERLKYWLPRSRVRVAFASGLMSNERVRVRVSF